MRRSSRFGRSQLREPHELAHFLEEAGGEQAHARADARALGHAGVGRVGTTGDVARSPDELTAKLGFPASAFLDISQREELARAQSGPMRAT